MFHVQMALTTVSYVLKERERDRDRERDRERNPPERTGTEAAGGLSLWKRYIMETTDLKARDTDMIRNKMCENMCHFRICV